MPCDIGRSPLSSPRELVTATYNTDCADVIDLQFSGLKDPLGATPSHPFWSVSRQAFIPAGELVLDEEVVALGGKTFRLTTITPRAGPEPVFNLEVANEHTYYVSRDGLLVHNAIYLTYVLRDVTGAVKYVGITKQLAIVRLLQHAKRLLNFNGNVHHLEVIGKFSGKDARRLARNLEGSLLKRFNDRGVKDLLNDRLKDGSRYYHAYTDATQGAGRKILSDAELDDALKGIYSILKIF